MTQANLSRMKSLIRPIWHLIWIPPLSLFLLTTEKEKIRADVRRWAELELGQRTGRSTPGNLVALLAEYKEFRNLYYFRVFQGNLSAILFLYIIRIFYQASPSLFIYNLCNIGPGLFIQHGYSTGIIADIGENCWINQQVSIGFNDNSGRYPTLGNNVRISAGAKVYGGITLGDNVIVGANAVVVRNVPANCVVVGVPAYIIKRDGVRVMEKL